MAWREHVHSDIKPHLERAVALSAKERRAYDTAPDPGNAQLWIVIAHLTKELSELKSQFGTKRTISSPRTSSRKK